MTHKEKEAFECAMLGRLPHEDLDFSICESGQYVDEETQSAWEGWLAARDHYAKIAAREALANTSHISAAIGYVSSIKPGTVITPEFVERWNSYYLPKLESAIKSAGVQFKQEA